MAKQQKHTIAPTPVAPVPVEPIPNSPALGGTELILAHLKKAFPELTDQVQIIMSRPQGVERENKPRILWLQDLPQDPSSAQLKDQAYRTNFNAIVFVSHWQQQMYNYVLGIPFAQGIVIKNAVPWLDADLPKPRGEKLQFIYTSTPHRGLIFLAEAARRLAEIRQDWELHVYSSLNIYGWHEEDKKFAELYEVLKKNPCVVYHGSVPNDEVRQAVRDAHVFVYPSTYMETSCMAIQEAMMAGCLAITTNFGALPETCGEWAWMFQYDERPDVLAARTMEHMARAIDTYGEEHLQKTLELQQLYFQRYYAFESRLPQWKALLEHVITQKPAEPMLVIE